MCTYVCVCALRACVPARVCLCVWGGGPPTRPPTVRGAALRERFPHKERGRSRSGERPGQHRPEHEETSHSRDEGHSGRAASREKLGEPLSWEPRSPSGPSSVQGVWLNF